MSQDWMQNITDLGWNLQNQYSRVAFYRPNLGTINFQCSLSKQKLQIQIAPPNKDSKPHKDNRNYTRDVVTYDYENALMFSINTEEAFRLLKHFDELLKGEYKSDSEKNENTMVFNHLIMNQVMYITGAEDKGANNTPTLKLSIYNTEKKIARQYIFRSGHELTMFRNILKHFYNDIPWMSLIVSGFLKSLRTAMYENQNNSGNNRSDNRNYNNRGGRQNNNRYRQQSRAREYDNEGDGDDTDDTPTPPPPTNTRRAPEPIEEWKDPEPVETKNEPKSVDVDDLDFSL